MNASRSHARWIVFSLFGAALLVGFTWWIFFRGEDGDVAAPRISPEEARALVERKDIALAELENANFAESFAELDAIAKALPQEPLPVQNRLLGLLWALRDTENHSYAVDANDPARRDAALAEAAGALTKLKQLSSDRALLHYLEAQLYLRRGELDIALEELRLAAAADPQDVVYPAQIYRIVSQYGDQDKQQEAEHALETAWRLRPENLHLLREWSYVQAQQQDPRLAETLKGMRQAFAPFFGTIQDQFNFDIEAAIDQALAAVRDGNWQAATNLASGIRNITNSLPAKQFDEWRLDPHELEFVLYDFGPEFYAEVELPSAPAPPAIPVKLAPAPEAWRIPEVNDAVAVRLADFDLDGRWDVIVLRPQRLDVYGRSDDQWRQLAAFDLPEGMTGVVAADLDRDIHENMPLTKVAAPGGEQPQFEHPQCLIADVDLIVYGRPGVLLLKNVYDREANSRSLESMIDEPLGAVKDVLAAAVADLDHDGDLDLILSAAAGMSLWSNRENFTFENISEYSAPPPAEFAATTIIPVDWDRDVYLDLILANAAGEAGVWKNYGHRNLRWEPLGAANQEQDATGESGLAVLDADGNVAWDLLSAGADGISLTTNANPRAGVVDRMTTTQVSPSRVSGLITWDYDNDGYLDVLAWSESGVLVFRGLPGGTFEPVENLFAEAPATIRKAHAADVDHDGDLDLLLETTTGLSLWLNDGGNANHWVSFSLGADREAQRPRERTNMHGVGSLVELKAGLLYQARTVDEQIIHLGLGKREAADLVRILWTNGIPQNEIHPQNGQSICVKQDLKGSCPYIYVWNGSAWVFYTDCLWAAPLGLQLARGVVAPAREWEYLQVSGNALTEDDGFYRLMITEELWEAAYFDEVRLFAVDHPADIEIFSNEKVGPAEIAEFRIHTVRNPRTPVAATNHRGRDVLDLVAHRDKEFVQLFDRGIRQGLVEPHYLELDLGRLEDPRQITLFLTGWTWPTDTSINLALDENPNLAGPQPPSLWVPNERGEWIEAIPYLGFPGGKTKTIAIDISGVFPTDDYRLRVQTSMEIYWDAAFFSVDEQAAEVRQQEAPLVSAELRYRGFSHRGERRGTGPERYDASRVDPLPHWPPMLGRFTRYGDATDLVRERDDRLAVFGAGDALELRFRKPAGEPPPGWKRDFLLYNVGWDKDADLNTVAGQTPEPLPFAAMPRYPLPADYAAPHTPALREYRRSRQTREQPRSTFWRLVREYRASGGG